MRPKPIIWSECALLLAVIIDLVNNYLAAPAMARGYAIRGIVLSPLQIQVAVFATPALGLILWYAISRRGLPPSPTVRIVSLVAKWLLTIYVALAIVVFFRQMTATPLLNVNTRLIFAIFAQLLKLFAVICLFMPSAQPWFREEEEQDVEEEVA